MPCRIMFVLIVVLLELTNNVTAQNCVYDGFSLDEVDDMLQLGFRTDVTLNISIVFHQLLPEGTEQISMAQIHQQLNALNRDFNKQNLEWNHLPDKLRDISGNANIEFCLAGTTYETTNIKNIGTNPAVFYSDLGGKDAWDTNLYLNVWICEMNPNLLGYASDPRDSGGAEDGVVINYKYFGIENGSGNYELGRTLVHEIGHYLGLPHPWGEFSNECEEDDMIPDTPPQKGPNRNCVRNNSEACSSDLAFGNFMDYSPDCCLAFFSHDQVSIMRASLINYRDQLVMETPCINPQISTTDLTVYPNPAQDIITLRWPKESHASTLSIFSIDGKILKQIECSNTKGEIVVCIEELPFGALVLFMQFNEGFFESTYLIRNQ